MIIHKPRSPFCEILDLKYPLIVAPMAGGPTTVDLVAASCQAGALGSFGFAYSTPAMMAEEVAQLRLKTNRPFAINLFIPTPHVPLNETKYFKAVAATEKFRAELGLAEPQLSDPFEENFDAQFEEALRLGPRVLSFIFGVLPPEKIRAAHARGVFLIGTATSLNEALELQEAGIDAVTAQGFESGGHRGIFDSKAADPEVTAVDLVRQLKSRLQIPIIAAGGIMHPPQVEHMLHLGVASVQMGTAFLATREAGTSKPFRRQLQAPGGRKTKTTRAFSGRLARGIVNRFMQEIDAKPDLILEFPIQNKFTRDLRKASLEKDSADFLSLWSGQGEGPLWDGSAQDLIRYLFNDDSSIPQ